MSVPLRSLCLAVLLSLQTLAVHAQPQRSVDLAREAYVQGLDAARNVRWADAVEHFRRSYELSHTTAALYNLGVALRALGRHREARDTFTELLEESPDLDAVTRQNAQKLRADASERVVPLRIRGFAQDATYAVVLDGVESEVSGKETFTLEVDEGRHALSVQRGAKSLLRWSGAVRAGTPLTLEIAVEEVEPPAPEVARVEPPVLTVPREEPPAAPLLPERERAPQEPAPRSRKVWWWVGGGAAVAAAVVGAVLYAYRRPEPRSVDIPAGTDVVDL